MEIELAMKLAEMDRNEIEQILMKLRMENQEAFEVLRELVDDII